MKSCCALYKGRYVAEMTHKICVGLDCAVFNVPSNTV